MTPIEALRAADPASDAGLDARAERELAALLAAEPSTGTRSRSARGRSSAPLLVTALVAAVVVAMTVAVLITVRPRSDVATTPVPSDCPTTGAAEALRCGTFRSTGGSGGLAFLGEHPYTLSFTGEAGLTVVLGGGCDTLHWAVRLRAGVLEARDGGGTQNGCGADERRRHARLADDFTAPGVRYSLSGDSLRFTFGNGGDTAAFVRVAEGATLTPPFLTAGCTPIAARPFLCGTYRSTGGGSAVTGSDGGPGTSPLSISFVPQRGAFVIVALSGRCGAAAVPVRLIGGRLERAGSVVTGEFARAGCSGRTLDPTSWAAKFLRGPLHLEGGGDLLRFGTGESSVVFEYQGAGEIGEAQVLRNETTCVPEHVAPFDCGTYRATGGTGSLAFLGAHPTDLRFAHLNGMLTASVGGWCNALWSGVATEGRSLVSYGVGGTQRACGRMPTSAGPASAGPEERRDDAWRAFFTGVLTVDQVGDTITFTRGGDSATFRRS